MTLEVSIETYVFFAGICTRTWELELHLDLAKPPGSVDDSSSRANSSMAVWLMVPGIEEPVLPACGGIAT